MNAPRIAVLAAAALAGALVAWPLPTARGAPAGQTGEAPARPGPERVSGEVVERLTITFHGVSTLMFDDGRTRVLVDGFFSRPNIARTLLLPLSSDLARVEAGLGPDPEDIAAVLAAHGHHDHALDIVSVAGRASGARVIGTPAVIRRARAGGVPAPRLHAPADRQMFEFGDFRVTAIHAPHGPGLPLISAIIDRPLTRQPGPAEHALAWADDANLSFLVEHGGRRILVHPSAGEIDLRALAPHVVFVGVGRLGAMSEPDAESYLEGLASPETILVVPIHWDAFTTAPGEPFRPTPWPFDNVRAGFERVCRHLAGPDNRDVVKLESGASVVLAADAVGFQGNWAPLCRPAS